MEQICLHCANILGCPMLADSRSTFVPERLVTPENYRECPDWKPISSMQHEVRKTLLGIQGENVLRVLYRVGTVIKNEEGANEMMEDMPDFAGMLKEGMMTEDREEQLRYETDEEGNVVLEDLGKGESFKRPRSTYLLRKFACDPEGYVQLDHSEGMFQTQDWLVKHILKIEIENGLLTKSKRTKTKAPEKTEAKQKETEDMAVGRKVLTRRGKGGASKGPKPGGAKVGRVGKPPKKAAATRDVGDDDDAPDGLPETPAFDMEALGETVEQIIEEKVARLEEKIEVLRTELVIFHDFMIQTSGTMEEVKEMFDNPNKVSGHLDGDDDEDPS